jgi:hypothetical protein
MRHDDVYLVSFPRSGNTWLSFMLANVIIGHCNLEKEVNFFNIHDFIPDIYVSRYIPKNLEFKPFPRIIKSHEKFNPYYKKVIWLVRNPRDVMISYWHYYKELHNKQISLTDFIRDKKYGISAWVKHTESYLNAPLGIRILLVKYEDLKRDSKREISKILRHLGILVSEDTIDRAIEKSSFEEMKKIEKETAAYPGKYQTRFVFMRKGKAGQKELSEIEEDYIRQKAGNLMKYFNYL